jgi:hypothetical protein
VDLTVTVFGDLYRSREGEYTPSIQPIAHRFPLTMQWGFRSDNRLSIPKGKEDTYRKSYKCVLRMVRELYEAAAGRRAGTDGMAVFGLHSELESYALAGIPIK